MSGSNGDLPVVGWREWVRLKSLGIDHVKAKIDTGARSSCLHAFDVHIDERHELPIVRFKVHPHQRDDEMVVSCAAPLLEFRKIRSSSGHITRRPVIRVPIRLLGHVFDVDLNLNNREEMGFRMLIGREALRGRFLVNPARSYLGGKKARLPKRQ